MLLPNAKRMNVKVLVLPFSDLCKRLQMSLGDEFFGKKVLHLCLQEDPVDNLSVILKKKRGNICIGEGNYKKMLRQ